VYQVNNIIDILAILAFIGSIVASFIVYTRSKVTKDTIKILQQSVDAYSVRVKQLEDQGAVDHQNHMDNIKAIADLQGQIKVYKELPLQEMAVAMQKISLVNEGIAKSNQLILDKLNTTIAVHEKGK
jgi:hypothetical protein